MAVVIIKYQKAPGPNAGKRGRQTEKMKVQNNKMFRKYFHVNNIVIFSEGFSKEFRKYALQSLNNHIFFSTKFSEFQLYVYILYIQRLTLNVVECFLSSDNTTTTRWTLRFNTAIVILCNYSENIEQIISNSSLLLEFNPNIYRLQSQHFPEINQTLQSETILAGRWIIRSLPNIEICGGPVSCGDEGQH